MFGKNNKMSYCQESPHCGAGVRGCHVCCSVCVRSSWLGMLQLKCEMPVFISERECRRSDGGWLGECREWLLWVLLLRTGIQLRDVHWLQNL